MNFPFFIAKRVAGRRTKHFSAFIIRIAVAAIALSVAVMIIATAMISGFKNEIRDKIFGFWGHIHIMHASVEHTLEARPISKDQPFYPHIDTIAAISYQAHPKFLGKTWDQFLVDKETRGGIRHVQVFALKPGIIKSGNQLEGVIVKGVDKDFNWEYLQSFIIEGEKPDLEKETPTREILVSEQTANRMELEIGDNLVVHFVEKGEQVQRKFKVCGIYRTGLEEYDKKFALADIRVLQQVLGWKANEVGGFEVILDDIEDVNIYKEYLYAEEMPMELYVESIRDKDPSIFDWLELQDINELVIMALMIVVAIINMVTALLILILERANMIGILKSLGARNWMVQKIFLYHAGYIIIVGLFWGNVVGLLFSFLEEKFKFIKLSEADYYLSYAPIELNTWTILALNAGTLVVTLVFLVLPSFLVASISPVKAIRFK